MRNEKLISILYVEDDAVDQKCFERMMMPFDNCSYLIAASVKVAHQALSKQNFDIIFLDNLLKDGTAADVLKEVSHRIPVVSVSGTVELNMGARAAQAKIKAKIAKPLRKKEFINVIRKLLRIDIRSSHQATSAVELSAPSRNTPKRSFMNLNSLFQIAGEDSSFVTEMLEMYRTQSNTLLQVIDSSFSTQNWGLLTATAHQFKSALNVIGATEMKRITENIEYCDDFVQKERQVRQAIRQLQRINHAILQEVNGLLSGL